MKSLTPSSCSVALLLPLLLASAGCEGPEKAAAPPASPAATAAATAIQEEDVARIGESIRDEGLRQHIMALSHDRMQGRLPGTEGEELTVAYLTGAFKEMGLEPANGDSYTQPVPLVGITGDPSMALKITGGEKERVFKYKDDFMGFSSKEDEQIEASGELVFVGYGTVAPEFNWDDYKGVDVAGKILVMLVNDPPLPDATRFGGEAMTYYGRWTYKYEIGAEMGAAGAIIIHETEKAGYPWGVVAGSWAGEQFVPERADKGASRMPFESWITGEAAGELMAMAGQDLEALKAAAAQDDFQPVPLGLNASISITNSIRRVQSKNVAGLLPGSDLADEWIIYTAHWDHLGVSDPVDGDAIYNGAFDNATGVAALIDIARAFVALPAAPRRSILFLAVTAEEQGLIGSYHYADNPLHPLAKTAGLINMDGMNVLGRTSDVIVVGLGNTTLDDLVTQVATAQGRTISPDMEPEKGFYYRSDQFPLAKKGVPALYTDHGINYLGRPEGWGQEQNAAYNRKNYHKPSDEYDPEWDLAGMVEDSRMLFAVGVLAAQADAMQQWKEGTEFKSVRQRSLAAGGGQ
jgi:Zn-dependent M28 family amino/carboxypeptidase